MDRKIFFDAVRDAPFGGALTQAQVEGMTQILDEWDRRGLGERRWLAYILATVFHETARQMQPIRELGSDTYLRSKPYYPWYGRGLVQITWKSNYDKFGITAPADAFSWPVALRVLFDGMVDGMFTMHKLGEYFSDEFDDPLNARRIINGTDKAALIAGYYEDFLRAIPAEQPINLPPVIPPAPRPQPGFWARLFGRIG